MPDPTATPLRQRPRLRAFSPPLLLALALFGCRSERDAPSPAAEPEAVAPAPGSGAAASHPEVEGGTAPGEAGAAPADADDAPSSEALLAAVPDTAVFAGALSGIDRAADARTLERLIPVDEDTWMLVGAMRRERETDVTTWLIDTGRPEAVVAPVDRVTIPHSGHPQVAPRVVEVPGVGVVVVQPTDSFDQGGASASFILRPIGLDANIPEDATVAPVDGWVVREAWDAERFGDGMVVCFFGARGTPDSAPPADLIVCGELDATGGWTNPPRVVVGSAPGTRFHGIELGAGGTDSALLVTTNRRSGAVIATLVHRREGRLAGAAPIALAENDGPYPDDFTLPGAPIFARTDTRIAWALPGGGDFEARSGAIALDGTHAAPPRSMLPFASMLERPRFVSGERVGVVMDTAGRQGERSVLVIDDSGALMVDQPALLDPGLEPLRALRLGPSAGNRILVVWDTPEPETVGAALIEVPGF